MAWIMQFLTCLYFEIYNNYFKITRHYVIIGSWPILISFIFLQTLITIAFKNWDIWNTCEDFFGFLVSCMTSLNYMGGKIVLSVAYCIAIISDLKFCYNSDK